MSFSDLLRVAPGTRPDLAAIDPRGTPGFEGDKAAAQARVDELRDELADFQERLWAEAGQSLLVVLQALDGGGKDGLIRKVDHRLQPAGHAGHRLRVPTEEELRHDFLWRVHAATPGKGRIGVFNRSHYEDVLVVRVKELVPESVWQDRYRQINDFEAMLAANSTRIVKFYLHISRDEQRERFVKRLAGPEEGLEVGSRRPRDAREVGRLPGGVHGCAGALLDRFGAVVRHPGRPQVVPRSCRRRDPGGDGARDGPAVARARGGPERGRRPGLSLAQPVLTRQARAKARIASIALGPASVVTDRSIFGSSATSRQISWMSFVVLVELRIGLEAQPADRCPSMELPAQGPGPSGAPVGP